MRGIVKQLGAKNWIELYQLGERAAANRMNRTIDPVDPIRAALAIQAISAEKGYSLTDIAKEAGVNIGSLSTFLNTAVAKFLSDDAVLRVARTLGANSAEELYRLGERAAVENPFEPARVAKTI